MMYSYLVVSEIIEIKHVDFLIDCKHRKGLQIYISKMVMVLEVNMIGGSVLKFKLGLLLEKIWALLFFLFFTAQILSPMINGRTVYMEIVIALLNPCFLYWMLKNFRFEKRYIFVVFSIGVFCICGHVETGIKFALILFEVICLFYLRSKNLWYIKFFFCISFAFLVAQQIFLVVFPEIAILIGPNNIAALVWGNYATSTFTNFYAIFEFGLPRTSGLSREAGFFASFLSVMLLNDYYDKKEENSKIAFLSKIMYAVAYIASFSKISLSLGIQIISLKFNKIFSYIPFGFIVILYFFAFSLLCNLNLEFLLDPSNITFLHRFGGYVSILDLDVWDIAFGIEISKIHDIYSMPVSELKEFAGFAGFIIKNGIISVGVFFIALYMLGINSLGVFLLMFTTLTTSPDTMQNFIVLQYYMLLKYRIFKNIILGY